MRDKVHKILGQLYQKIVKETYLLFKKNEKKPKIMIASLLLKKLTVKL